MFLSLNVGRAFGECAAGFDEVGLGYPPFGGAVTAYRVFTLKEVLTEKGVSGPLVGP